VDLDIPGKRAIVVGASQGVGRVIATQLADEGALVTAIARRADVLQELVDEMGGETAGHSSLAADLMHLGEPTRVARSLLDAGSVDIVVHCVGGTLDGYVKVLGRQVAPDGVVVAAIQPGAYNAPGGRWDEVKRDRPEMYADFIRHHQAIGRVGVPEEIAPLAVFLSSQQASFCAGSLMQIDGGTM
jgi:NAD(P)-dependent dehydrogenase (short-subunit alcohol dehydrogenase family)